jgi:hypothetical protein
MALSLPSDSYDVASAANGVFLCVELVVNTLCSEIRTGCSLEQLRISSSHFPTDLDDYFQKLIFGRIGTTRPNAPKTAAALKLAMVLNSHEVEVSNIPHEEVLIPIPDDYLNFWLLSIGQLKPGFSWTDPLDPRYSAFDTEKKFRQTKAFLEETCKDLLVIRSYGQSYNVGFLHRTVLDFLCDNPASLPIEKHAPVHFSDEGFAMDLLRLRCICRLRENNMDCSSSTHLLDDILMFSRITTALEIDQPWLLACESTVLETFQTRCNCLGLEHLRHTFLAEDCAIQGLHRYLLEIAQDMPHEAVRLDYLCQHDYLSLALLELEKADTRKATAIRLLNQALECGGDPNVFVDDNHSQNSCRQSRWECWLHVQYLYSQHRRVARGDGTHRIIGATKDVDCQRVQENAAIIHSLLRHGADPNCTPCTADHVSEPNCSCSPTVLHDILEVIVPAECLSPLQTLVVACSGEDRRNTLRRNQRKRAVRSYIISERKFASRVIDRCPQTLGEKEAKRWTKSRWFEWRDHQMPFLRSLMVSEDMAVECRKSDEEFTGLLTWCVDCESRSLACLSCCRPHYMTKGAPCTNSPEFRVTQPEGHTTVAVLFDVLLPEESRWGSKYADPASLSTAYQSLGCGPGELDFTPGTAISVLKEWYAKNPIEPDPFQDDFQDMALPEGMDLAGLSSDEPAADEASNSR